VFTGGASVIAPTVSSANAALIGDSLTDDSFGLTTFTWMNGIAGGNLKLIANSGHSGDTVANMLARVDNAWNAPSRGLAGLTDLEWIIFRGGTNDWRAGTPIVGALTSDYNALMAKLAGYAANVGVLAVPPGAGGGVALAQDYNSFLGANFNSGQFHFIDDCVNVRDGSGNQLAGFFDVDQVHPVAKGVYQMGVDGGALQAPLMSGFASPLSTDAADIYPAHPQWHPNPTNVGTGGTVGSGFTGTAPNGVSVGAIGAGVAGAVAIVAADVGDLIQTPWTVIDITQGQNGSAVAASVAAAGRAITGVDPVAIDQIVQVRFANSFDATNVSAVTFDMQGTTTGEHLQSASLKLLGATGINKTVTVRRAVPRGMSGDAMVAQAGANVFIQMPFVANFGPGPSIGTFAFRCYTLRG
jgi:hypothetical protein